MQPVVAMAACCPLGLSVDPVGCDLASNADRAFDMADITIEMNGSNTSDRASADNCVECNDCSCCALFTLPGLQLEPLLQSAHTVFSDYAPLNLTSTYSCLLRPPKA